MDGVNVVLAKFPWRRKSNREGLDFWALEQSASAIMWKDHQMLKLPPIRPQAVFQQDTTWK